MKQLICVLLMLQLFLLPSCDNRQDTPGNETPQTGQAGPVFEEGTPSAQQNPSVAEAQSIARASLAAIIGFWAHIEEIDDDGRSILDGFYFDEDGTGWMFHNLEGSFEITAYQDQGNEMLTVYYRNMADELVDLSYIVHTLTEDELALAYAPDGTNLTTYARVGNIEATSGTGTYVVTELDGRVLDIWGWG